ncbi:MAG: sulfatase-like hydrolase/transferase [Gemmatimonadota bacterium]
MNLLLVSLDSLRVDSVSRTAPRVHTPRFDAATAGFLFSDRCFSVSSATRPVHLSVFSGLYPFEHGIEGQRQGRQRQSIPLLFHAAQEQGYAVGAWSEAASIFAGLDLGASLAQLPGEASQGLQRLSPWIERGRHQPVCLFAHYWSAHAPYGAADGRAMGETLRLLEGGRREEVEGRYLAAVEGLLETKVAPLLEACDRQRWCVLIFSDHGESWDAQEPYHGQTLRNSVLRVPVYYHVPFSGNPLPRRPLLSLLDVHPTLCAALGWASGYRGFGKAWTQADEDPLYLAQIAVESGGDRAAGRNRTTGARAGAAPQRKLWAAFDRRWKYSWEEGGRGRLEPTLEEGGAGSTDEGQTIGRLLAAYQRLREASRYAGGARSQPSREDGELLDRRLRELGYLD